MSQAKENMAGTQRAFACRAAKRWCWPYLEGDQLDEGLERSQGLDAVLVEDELAQPEALGEPLAGGELVLLGTEDLLAQQRGRVRELPQAGGTMGGLKGTRRGRKARQRALRNGRLLRPLSWVS